MNQGKLVFAQLAQHLPLTTFRRCVAKYDGEHKVKSFPCLDQYFCMAFAQLTRREAQVLRELATGASPDEVARLSYVSLNTVRSQIRSVLAKLGVNSVVAAVALAYRSGWLAGDGRLNRPL